MLQVYYKCSCTYDRWICIKSRYAAWPLLPIYYRYCSLLWNAYVPIYNTMGFFGLRPDALSWVFWWEGWTRAISWRRRWPDRLSDRIGIAPRISIYTYIIQYVIIILLSRYTRRKCGGRPTLNGWVVLQTCMYICVCVWAGKSKRIHVPVDDIRGRFVTCCKRIRKRLKPTCSAEKSAQFSYSRIVILFLSTCICTIHYE